MQAKLGDSIMIIGNASKDAEFKHVGEKQTPNSKFSLIIGKDADNKSIFVDCEAWSRLAYIASQIQKGDIVMAIGTVKTREYNGKTYKTLTADWVDIKGSTAKAEQPASQPQTPPAEAPMNLNPEDTDGLPF
jgi:single-stranded DNA-binding protein